MVSIQIFIASTCSSLPESKAVLARANTQGHAVAAYLGSSHALDPTDQSVATPHVLEYRIAGGGAADSACRDCHCRCVGPE